MTPKPRSHVRILIYRTWAINNVPDEKNARDLGRQNASFFPPLRFSDNSRPIFPRPCLCNVPTTVITNCLAFLSQ